MTDEHLETEITDGGYGAHEDPVFVVEIMADGERKDDFDAVRNAVRDSLDSDDEEDDGTLNENPISPYYMTETTDD